MNPHLLAVNIFAAQATKFTNPKTGGIQNSKHGFCLQIRHRGNEVQGFVLGRNVRKIGIKFARRKLCLIPRLMQDIDSKETQLCNCGVNGAF